MEDPKDMAETMLSDVLISNVYNQFMSQNEVLFKDKVVLDVGCRSGMLSYLSVEAGAVKVFAVGNMKSARTVAKIFSGGEKAEIFEPLSGSITELTLPSEVKKVDIIVSEWMGNALYADSLYCQVIYARNKWLAKGGYIIPNVAHLFISGLWRCPRQSKDESSPPVTVVDDYVYKATIITEKCLLKSVNLLTANENDELFSVEFMLKALNKGKVCACMLHFDIATVNAKGRVQKLFSISPESPRTYLKQTVLLLEEDTLEVVDQQLLVGRFSLLLSNLAPRGVEFSLGIWIPKSGTLINKG